VFLLRHERKIVVRPCVSHLIWLLSKYLSALLIDHYLPTTQIFSA